jgi:hypothetical protein
VAKRERELVDPLHVVDENQRRTDHAKRTVRGLEDPQRLKRCRFLASVIEEQRLQPARSLRSGERQQEIGGCRERHFAFRLVANDAEPVRQARLRSSLCQQPALPAAGLADNDSSRDVPRRSGATDLTKFDELLPSAHERIHMPKRTTTSETPITDDVTEIWKPNASHEGHAVRAVESHLAVWASHAPGG